MINSGQANPSNSEGETNRPKEKLTQLLLPSSHRLETQSAEIAAFANQARQVLALQSLGVTCFRDVKWSVYRAVSFPGELEATGVLSLRKAARG
ncbi:hypothetical protein E2C01_084479 [Portunus trituberculatus]|uniref:Uncharacterized protein n=1 Tax=Portunus trituberculatus TaxID=210409 RepID=A0A5B7J7M7_PORTR|nr:hypothetical protein [Portunus trituberculatus]